MDARLNQNKHGRKNPRRGSNPMLEIVFSNFVLIREELQPIYMQELARVKEKIERIKVVQLQDILS